MQEYHVLGIMSGSSLDGLDCCLSVFKEQDGHWSFHVLKASTLEFPGSLIAKLRSADKLTSLDLQILDHDYGLWIGQQCITFLAGQPTPQVIAIHGHTVFHEPNQKISLQIGSGRVIAQITGIPTVDEFRSSDLDLGGQGAPLVPFGEQLLFPGIPCFVNLGGICNVSIHAENIIAWDIAPCNQVFNHFAEQLGQPYDHGGSMAKQGKLDQSWLNEIKQLNYFSRPYPKSLSNQWTRHILDLKVQGPQDGLYTYVEFLSQRINEELSGFLKPGDRVLITGGGSFNNYLISEINRKNLLNLSYELPSEKLNAFKEALIFGFLGLFRFLNRPNIIASVTGAKHDHMGGTLHLGD